jgi:hypothetical protein
MDGDAVSVLDACGQIPGTERGVLLTRLANQSQHFGREFVSFPRPSPVRHQRRQATLTESSLRLVKGGT